MRRSDDMHMVWQNRTVVNYELGFWTNGGYTTSNGSRMNA
jgi:hypothetical protein